MTIHKDKQGDARVQHVAYWITTSEHHYSYGQGRQVGSNPFGAPLLCNNSFDIYSVRITAWKIKPELSLITKISDFRVFYEILK